MLFLSPDTTLLAAGQFIIEHWNIRICLGFRKWNLGFAMNFFPPFAPYDLRLTGSLPASGMFHVKHSFKK